VPQSSLLRRRRYSLALRELDSNRVLPAAPPALLPTTASPHPAHLAIGLVVLKPLGEQTHTRSISKISPRHVDRAQEWIGPASGRAPAQPIPRRPLRKSTGLVATSTRTVPDNPITRRPSTLAAPPRSSWRPRHDRPAQSHFRPPPQCFKGAELNVRPRALPFTWRPGCRCRFHNCRHECWGLAPGALRCRLARLPEPRRHKPISDSEISTVVYHPAS
jgi:hypothetical protein